MKEKNKIGFIGLGAMGSKMAGRLLSQGFALGVYNRTPSKADELVNRGAWRAENPKELAAHSDVVIMSVTDDAAVREITMGEFGAFAGAPKGTVFIDCSTVSVRVTRELAEEAERLGFHWLDAPVLGNPKMSEDGTQAFVVGGSQAVLEENKNALEAIGTKIVYIGGAGLGQAAKIVHNLVCGISLEAYGEALVLGEHLGLSRKQVLDALRDGAVGSKLLTIKTEKLETNIFEPTAAPLVNMRKDLMLAEDAADLVHLTLPALEKTKEMYDYAMSQGLEREDTSSVVKALRVRAKHKNHTQ